MMISELLPLLAQKCPGAAALKHRDEVVTYQVLHERASRLATALAHLGVGRGDRVALLGQPCIELCVWQHAAVAAGAVPVGVSPCYAPIEIQAIIDHAEPAAIVFDGPSSLIVEQLTLAKRPVLISCDERPGADATTPALLGENFPRAEWPHREPDDIALLIYTSGTTGRPKGVVHTLRSLSTWMTLARGSPGDHSERKGILFNLAHFSGQSMLWTITFSGGCLTFLDRYPAVAQDVADVVERERITTLGTVPGTVRALLALADIEQRDFRSVRSISIGGGHISPHTLMRTACVFSSALIGNVYSLTETGQVVSVLVINQFLQAKRLERLRSVGAPAMARVFGQEPFSIRIVDDGRDLPRGQTGEIVVRGAQMMRGYWNNPEATQGAMKDGWLFTGDLGWMDDDGYLHLADRKKDRIIVDNGDAVYCGEVEDVVGTHPSVVEASVIARRRENEEEEVAVVVVVREGHRLSLEELQRFCANRIAAFKIPKHLVVVDALPRTPADKIDRSALRRLVARPIAL